MSNVIKPKRGTTDPAPGILAEGEIGINTSAATAFVGVVGGGRKKLNAGNSETADAVNSTGETTANTNRHVWFSDADDEKKRAYNGNFQYNPSTNTISANVGGTSSNVTGTVGIAHGGTGANNATDARINLSAAASVVEHYAPYYGANTQPYTDLWMIDINSPFGDANSDWSFGTEDASTLINSPVTSGPFYGYRKVYQVHSSAANHYKTIVEIHEAYPMRGRIWTSEYNPAVGWAGWWHNYTNADQIPVSNGGTGASNSYTAQTNLNIVHGHDIVASNKDDWRTQALAQIAENAKAGGFQCGGIGWQGVQFGQYFATTSGETTNRILALIYNSAGTNWALEVWRYDGGVWNACAVNGASLQTMPGLGYGTADQRPSAGLPGRIWFQKV